MSRLVFGRGQVQTLGNSTWVEPLVTEHLISLMLEFALWTTLVLTLSVLRTITILEILSLTLVRGELRHDLLPAILLGREP